MGLEQLEVLIVAHVCSLRKNKSFNVKHHYVILITVVNFFLFCIRPKKETCQNLNFQLNNPKKTEMSEFICNNITLYSKMK